MVKSTWNWLFCLLNTGANAVSSSNKNVNDNRLWNKRSRKLCIRRFYFCSWCGSPMAKRWGSELWTLLNKLLNRRQSDDRIFISFSIYGLGAPYWDPDCRGAIFDITRDSGREELRAALEAVCYQTGIS